MNMKPTELIALVNRLYWTAKAGSEDEKLFREAGNYLYQLRQTIVHQMDYGTLRTLQNHFRAASNALMELNEWFSISESDINPEDVGTVLDDSDLVAIKRLFPSDMEAIDVAANSETFSDGPNDMTLSEMIADEVSDRNAQAAKARRAAKRSTKQPTKRIINGRSDMERAASNPSDWVKK
jgi:hypothetical protein